MFILTRKLREHFAVTVGAFPLMQLLCRQLPKSTPGRQRFTQQIIQVYNDAVLARLHGQIHKKYRDALPASRRTIEISPKSRRYVANIYHLWVLPEGLNYLDFFKPM